MKKFKYLIFLISIIIVVIIYHFTTMKNYNYLSIGDTMSQKYGNYIYSKLKDKITNYNNIEISNTNELIHSIEDNVKINNKTIQNVIFNANIITLSIGLDEVIDDELITRLDILLKLIKMYNKDKIYITNYYNYCDLDNECNKNDIQKLNNNLNKLCKKYDINCIDIYNLFNNNEKLLYQNYPYPNNDGYKLIANEIIRKITL